MRAIPAPGYIFVEWHDDVEGTSKSATIVINCDTSVTAVFTPGETTFAWWWLVAGIGAISLMIAVFLRHIRKTYIPG